MEGHCSALAEGPEHREGSSFISPEPTPASGFTIPLHSAEACGKVLIASTAD